MMQTAIVTGVTGGIGNETAKLFLEKGWRVVGVGRSDISKAENLTAFGERFLYVQGDVSVSDTKDRAIQAALDGGNTISALINVAGVAPKVRADLLEMTEESYDYVMDINAKGTFFFTQTVAKEMIKAADKEKSFNGAIVNIASISSYTSSVNRGEYCISKAGISMMTQLFADRLAEYHITVNEIRPGVIQTNMTAGVTEKYDKLIEEGTFPIARWGTPSDVAKAVFLFADGTLSYTTGEALSVDGGFCIRRL